MLQLQVKYYRSVVELLLAMHTQSMEWPDKQSPVENYVKEHSLQPCRATSNLSRQY